MPKPLKKDTHIKVYCDNKTKIQIEKLQALSGKQSISEFVLEVVLNNTAQNKHDYDSLNALTLLIKEQYKRIEAFQKQQEITMYMIMQMSLYLASFNKGRDEIMDFYDDAYKGAIEKFGKED